MRTNRTRTIRLINDPEDALEEDLKLALASTMEENFIRYCSVVNAQLALMRVDPDRDGKRTIRYIEP